MELRAIFYLTPQKSQASARNFHLFGTWLSARAVTRLAFTTVGCNKQPSEVDKVPLWLTPHLDYKPTPHLDRNSLGLFQPACGSVPSCAKHLEDGFYSS